ncbi:hypothetical protein [Corallococcus terminator]|uniref:Uncharacterized protein n=1 Tax=Corallococcus terminator TaxID=2316733 RepID=A0A3A8J5M6_9BACT|nr:hypothetical protein [Corallococcus terminator]RKG90939.1 hypothetical protein D7V88_10290 [Corallococcus terminator]
MSGRMLLGDDDEDLSGDDDYRQSFREELARTLNLATWAEGLDIQAIMQRYRDEIGVAVRKEDQLRTVIREKLLPKLKSRPQAAIGAGVYRVSPEEVAAVHESLLFSGNVEGVNGISVSHETLPLDITQLGIAAVSYGGTSGTFSQRLFRREVSIEAADPYEEASAYIEMRENRSQPGRSGQDSLSRLARRGIRTYAERAILVEKLKAEWRMGQGNPFAYELITGSGYTGLLDSSLTTLTRLMEEHPKFVFVPAQMDNRGFLTLGQALNAGEFAILETLERTGSEILRSWQYDTEGLTRATTFVKMYCPQVVMGLFRASNNAPPQIFYAHVKHAHMAACVAIADSVLRADMGFPMLLDVAAMSCRSAFGEDGFHGLIQDAYAQADASLQYFNGRKARR